MTTTLTPAAATDLFRSAPDRMIDVGHGAVAHRQVGSGPDVLFVHGWPVSGATYRTLLPHLAPHVTCHVLDLVGSGSSRIDPEASLSIHGHIAAVRTVVDQLGLDDVAVVGHDSGGLIARHALAGDPRVRAFGLLDTETPDVSGLFALFVRAGRLPGFGRMLAWAANTPAVRRNPLVLGGSFSDRSLLEGEFAELFLEPLRQPDRRRAADQLIKSFDMDLVRGLPAVHARIDVPVKLVWGADDPFLPVAGARRMLDTFSDASLHVVEDAKLFVHEEHPAEVAAALLQVLL